MRCFVALLMAVLFQLSVFAQDPLAITREMFSRVKALKTIRFDFDSKERVKGKMYQEIASFKLQTSPFKVYFIQKVPKQGIEGLFVTGENDNKVKINPNSFPWVSLNLAQEGDLMMDNHHHSLLHAGYGYTITILEELINKYQGQSLKLISMNGIIKFQGVDCYSLTLTNPNYKTTIYTAQTNETPISIAKKLKINYFSILENNPGSKANATFKQGTKVIVPVDYASRMDLYIQVNQLIPVWIKIYDNKGVFEEYTFSNVVINPVFNANDFSAQNPQYHF